MRLKDQAGWEKGLQNNTDPYGAYAYRYAEAWANMMESEIDNGARLQDVADRTSHEADTEGITGFMYGCAVNVLAHCWEHGEELRKWHNGEYKYDGAGVVNPAVLTLG